MSTIRADAVVTGTSRHTSGMGLADAMDTAIGGDSVPHMCC